MSRRFLLRIALLTLLAGCASRPSITTREEGPRIRRVTVQAFEGPGGADITKEFLAALGDSGWEIVNRLQKPDATLSGAVTGYKPGRKLMVFLGNTQTLLKDQMLTLSNPILSGGGGLVVPQAATAGNNPRVVTENAVIQLRVWVADSSGNPVWDHEHSYEALDMQTARQAVVGTLARLLKRTAPQLRQRPPLSNRS